MAASLGNKESGVEAGDGPDLEKMSLGEWFDYLEVYLPKQIHEETEEMILRMNQRAEQFHEFVLKQMHDKEGPTAGELGGRFKRALLKCGERN